MGALFNILTHSLGSIFLGIFIAIAGVTFMFLLFTHGGEIQILHL